MVGRKLSICLENVMGWVPAVCLIDLTIHNSKFEYTEVVGKVVNRNFSG